MFLVTVVAGIQLYAHDQTAEERTVLKKQTGVLAAAGKVIVEQAAKSIADYISKNLVQHSTFVGITECNRNFDKRHVNIGYLFSKHNHYDI